MCIYHPAFLPAPGFLLPLYQNSCQLANISGYNRRFPLDCAFPFFSLSHTLADRLRFHWKQAGLTQREAARALHISTAAYSHYETGRRLPSPDLFLRIAELFQTTMEALLYDGKNSLRAFLSQTERLSPTEMRELEIFIDFLLGRETP